MVGRSRIKIRIRSRRKTSDSPLDALGGWRH